MAENFGQLLDENQRLFSLFMDVSKSYTELLQSKEGGTDKEGVYARVKLLMCKQREAAAANKSQLQSILRRVLGSK